MGDNRSSGRIEIICGPMFSGKTSELFRRLGRLHYAQKSYVLFKPKMDTRYSSEEVVSHSQEAEKAIPVERASDILFYMESKFQDIKIVAIDEVQFFSKAEEKNIFTICCKLRKRGYRVLVCGLDMDYHGNPFGMMGDLMAVSDVIHKLTAVCAFQGCGEPAPFSYKFKEIDEKVVEGNVIELGESDKYEARCLKHWSDCSLFENKN